MSNNDTLYSMHTHIIKRTFLLLIITLFVTSVSLSVHAQTPTSSPTLPQTQEEWDKLSKEEQDKLINAFPPSVLGGAQVNANTPGAVNCFDYYKFGSVQVDAAPTIEKTLPGVTLPFKGTIKNENPYPLVDGQVWMKVFKHDDTSEALTKENGDPLVAFVLVEDDIVLSGTGERPIDFTWDVPKALGAGMYTAAFYFTTAHRYNLLGLSFTDDVTGNKATFTITPTKDTTNPVVWNKNKVTLNETRFSFATPPPHFTSAEPVTAHVELTNPSNESRVVEVTWITSQWDGILPQHDVKRETQGYTLKPHETKQLAYTPLVFETSVIFLQAILTDRDAQSIMHIRYVRDGFPETRINFPSVMEYPFKAGKEATIFSCVHSTNLPVVPDNTLTLTLKDKDGKVVHTYTYTGDITGSMMGLKDTFTPTADLSNFSLTASLARKGVLVDEVTEVYDCNRIDPGSCVKDTPETPLPILPQTFTLTPTTIYTVLAASIILLILCGIIIIRSRKTAIATVPVTTPEPYDTNI